MKREKGPRMTWTSTAFIKRESFEEAEDEPVRKAEYFIDLFRKQLPDVKAATSQLLFGTNFKVPWVTAPRREPSYVSPPSKTWKFRITAL